MVVGVSKPSSPRHSSCQDVEAVQSRPLKRKGLSKFYQNKARSFTSFEDVLSTEYGQSSLALAKCSSGRAMRSETGSPISSERQHFGEAAQRFSNYWVSRTTEDLCAALNLTSLAPSKVMNARGGFHVLPHQVVLVGSKTE